MRKGLFACVLMLFVAVDAQAALLVRYDFSGLAGDQNSTVATTTLSGLSAGNIVRGSGISSNAGADSMNSNGFTGSTSIDLSDYYGFSLTATGGSTFNLTTLAYGDRRSGTGPRNFSVRTSLDNFASDAFTYTIPTSTSDANRSFTFTGSQFNNLSTIQIRIYGFNATNTTGTGTYRLNNGNSGGLRLDGDLNAPANPVPVPASLLLVASGAPALLLMRRRR